MKNAFDKMLSRIGQKYAREVLSLGIEAQYIREIRFAVNEPLWLVTEKGNVFSKSEALSKSDIQEIFAALCEYSVHTYKNEICEGFITAEGGCRVGICGTAVYENEKIIGIKDISSLNIRIPREVFGAADAVIPYFEHGVLIVGPPCSGKTTLLRDAARQISTKRRVTIVDERMEIAGIYRGEPFFDIGHASVLNGFIKSDGIKIAARAMAPEVIICDEFGDEKDIASALFAMKSGVNIIASMHAFDKNDLLTKPFFDKVLENKIFGHIAFLNKYCKIYEIVRPEDIQK